MRIVLLFVCCLQLSACVLVPLIQGVKDVGVSKSDRMRLFEKAVNDFMLVQKSGRIHEMSTFVDDKFRAEFMQNYRINKRNEKLVNMELDWVEFNENGDEAYADILTKYYKIPEYIVRDRYDKQVWEFHVGGTWLLKSLKQEDIL